MKKILVYVVLSVFFTVHSTAQSKRKISSKPNAYVNNKVKNSEQQITQMEIATQKIIFIDSIVVNKDSFLMKYYISHDAGRLYKYDDFFNENKQPNAYVYVNGLGDKCYFSMEDSIGNFNLYTSDNFNDTWTKPMRLSGLDGNGYKSLNYPFMMPDGATLYFAATGDKSIGGYDIFVTRYDSENGIFLKAENIGMPFNSTANDYMFVIDEFSNIGWFATDRNQTEGKVCIYIFVPSESRQLYSPDEYTEDRIRSLARLECIADTWGKGNERKEAIERLKSIYNEQKKEKAKFVFIINDNIIYRQISDFKCKDNADKFQEIQAMEMQKSNINKALSIARNYYLTANINDKNSLKDEILESERQIEAIEIKINSISKEIRISESRLLNTK